MTPPRLIDNRPFVGLNVATLLIYTGLSIMFFLLSFDLVDRRGLTPTSAGLAFLPFTLGVAPCRNHSARWPTRSARATC